MYHRGRPFVGDMTTNNAKLTHNVNQYAKGNRLHYQNMKLTMFCAIPNTLRTFLYIHVCVCVFRLGFVHDIIVSTFEGIVS